jgi:hypothetical protein
MWQYSTAALKSPEVLLDSHIGDGSCSAEWHAAGTTITDYTGNRRIPTIQPARTT